jgi:hypothetical protein
MTTRRVAGYTVTSRPGEVYLIDDATGRDSNLSIDDAVSLGEALLLGAREAARVEGWSPTPADYLNPDTDPLFRELVFARLAEKWPITKLTADDMASIESEWRALRSRGKEDQ